MRESEPRISDRELARRIDHTLLRPEACWGQIKQLCREAEEYGFYSVCVNGRWIASAADLLEGTDVKVCGVVSFPLGGDSTGIKVAQAKRVIFDGADEVDMVADLAGIVEGDAKYLGDEIGAVLQVCHSMKPAVRLKVIIEAAALGTDEKIFACQIAQQAGVDFIKTSTGFHRAGGATVEDVKLIKETAPGCRVKASGGIRCVGEALAMLKAGADRIGTSSGVQIIKELRAEKFQ